MDSVLISPNRYVGRIKKVRLIVVHTMEVGESSNVAETVAKVFATQARNASAHWCVDDDSAVRCVYDEDTAWACPGANADGLQLELAGRANQGAEGWADPYSLAVLARGAQKCAEWVDKFAIPVRHLSVAELRAGQSGFIGHVDASLAYGKTDHTDPGPTFPWDSFLAQVSGGAVVPPVTPPSTGLDMDGSWGPATTRALQARFGTPVDGVISGQVRTSANAAIPSCQWGRGGSLLVRAMQRWLGVADDGNLGPQTVRALQARMGTPVDGVISNPSLCVKEMQRRLNANAL